MTVTPEYVKKELEKLGKKERANERQRQEYQEQLEKTNITSQNSKYEAVALRTLAAGNIPKSARPAMAQQLAEVMGVDYNEASIMELIAKYEKQDKEEVTPISVPDPTPKKAEVEAEVIEVRTDEPAAPPKRRGRPALTPEQKAENARKRALAAKAATATTAAAAPEPEEHVNDLDDDEDEYFDPADYDSE